MEALAEDLRTRGELDLSECFTNGTFIVAKRGRRVRRIKQSKDTKLMAAADAAGLPPAVHPASASPHAVTPVRETLLQSFTAGRLERLIGDKAYDSDLLDEALVAITTGEYVG